MTREEAIETLKANYPDRCYESLRNAVDIAIESLEAEPIVRCKNCKYNYANMIPGCKGCQQNVYIEVDDNFFCADGKRMSEVEE